MAVHKRWADVEYWKAIKRRAPALLVKNILKGMDMYKNESGEIVSVEEDRRIHRILWLRTLEIAFFVTLILFFDGISNSSFVSYFTNEVQ
jgi:putative spermidine/putrescine transport system permease protein